MTVTNQPDLSDRVVLITGASRGIGREAALFAASCGAHVIAVARTQGGLEELDDAIRAGGGAATLVVADIRDGDALDRLGGAIHQRWGRLDGLIANAGILGQLTPAPHIEPKVWDDVIAINLTANVRLIRSLDPLLRQSSAGRAVFVTSGAAPRPRAFWGPYAASKAGLEALITCYAEEAEASGVLVNLFDPGATATDMRAKAMPGEDPATLPSAEDVARAMVALIAPSETRTRARIAYRELAASSA